MAGRFDSAAAGCAGEQITQFRQQVSEGGGVPLAFQHASEAVKRAKTLLVHDLPRPSVVIGDDSVIDSWGAEIPLSESAHGTRAPGNSRRIELRPIIDRDLQH